MADDEELVDENNQQMTMVAGAVIEPDYVYVAQYLDRYEKISDDYEYTRISQVDLANEVNPWGAHDRPWKIVSVCVSRTATDAARLYVSLSSEGEVELMGPGGRPMLVEHIEGAGLNRPWSRFLGYLNKIREIGASLYACGGANQVYRRTPGKGWELISNDILVDPHERQNAGSSLSGIRSMMDISGQSEEDIYTVGLEGEIYHFDGGRWSYVSTGTRNHLTCICEHGKKDMLVAGSRSTLLRGNADDGFISVWPLIDEVYFTGIASFLGKIFLATSSRGLYVYDPVTNEAGPYHTTLDPDFRDPHSLEARDGVLWVFGFKDLACFDGVSWTRIHHPDNPPVGR